MRRARINYTRPPSRRGGRGMRRGGGGYVPYLPGRSPERESDFRKQIAPGDERISYFCELCKQQMSSKAAYISHCNTAFHKEKEGKQETKEVEQTWQCDTCELKFQAKILLDQHCLLVRHQPKYRSEGLQKQEDADKDGDKSGIRHGNEQGTATEKKQLFSFGPLKPPNYCDICQVDCLNNSNMRVHLESWRHRAAVDRKKEEVAESKKENEAQKAEKEKDADVSGSKIADFYCDVCDCHSTSNTNYTEHIGGKKHKKHVSEMQPPYTCLFCNMKFGSTIDFNEHYESAGHIAKASKKTGTEAEIPGDKSGGKFKKFSSQDRSVEKEARSEEKKRGRSRDQSRGRSRDRSRGRSRGRSRDRSRNRSRNRGKRFSRSRSKERGRSKERVGKNDRKSRRTRSSSFEEEEKEKNSRERSKEKSAKKNAKEKGKGSGKDEDTKKKKRKRRRSSSSPSIESNSGSDVLHDSSSDKKRKKKKSKSSAKKEKAKKKSEKSPSKGGKTEKEGRAVYEDHGGERKVEIKEESSEEEVGDLREKLNRGKNIVITRKIKNEGGDHMKADSEDASGIRNEMDTEGDQDSELKNDEEIILSRHKADLVLREQLLKEHTLEIFKYKDAEEEYKRLVLEEDYLKRRLDLFRDGDPRKESDIADLERIQVSVREVREELEIRDLMIQEKERYLVVLKNRIEEREKIVVESEKAFKEKQTAKFVEQKVEPKKTDFSLPERGAEIVKPKKENEQVESQVSDSEDDLRSKIEKERLLRKLGPEIQGLDPSIRQRILDAVVAADGSKLSPEIEKQKAEENWSSQGRNANRLNPKEPRQESRLIEQSASYPSSHQKGQRSYEEFERFDKYPKEDVQTQSRRTDNSTTVDAAYVEKRQHQNTRMSLEHPETNQKRNFLLEKMDTGGQTEYHLRDNDEPMGEEKANARNDMEEFWIKRERELRMREEELRKREQELLERERKRKMEEQQAPAAEKRWHRDSFKTEEEDEEEASIENKGEKFQGRGPVEGQAERTSKREVCDSESDDEPASNASNKRKGTNGRPHRASRSPARRSHERFRSSITKSRSPDSFSSETSLRRSSYDSNRRREGHSRKSSSRQRRRSRTPSESPERHSHYERITKEDGKINYSHLMGENITAPFVNMQPMNPFSTGFPMPGQSREIQDQNYGEPWGMEDSVPEMDLYGGLENQPITTPNPSSALKEIVRVSDKEPSARAKATQSSGRREQFALWKSGVSTTKETIPAVEEKKDDIWDTAFGTENKEEEDKVVMDIFADLDEESDFMKGRLHRVKKGAESSLRSVIPVTGKAVLAEVRRKLTKVKKNEEKSDVTRMPVDNAYGFGNQSHSLQQQKKGHEKVMDEEELLYGTENAEDIAIYLEKNRQAGSVRKMPAAVKSQSSAAAAKKEEGMAVKSKLAQQQPRGILKRGILKKPTETFHEKSDQEKKEEKESARPKEGSGKPEEEENEKRAESKVESAQGKTGKQGVITPDDLERIRMIIDGLKKQYGPEWDSSKIEDELKLVLERQRASAPGERPTDKSVEQQLVKSDEPPKEDASKEKALNEERKQGVVETERSAKSQSTLFPIRIPQKSTSPFTTKDIPSFPIIDKSDDDPVMLPASSLGRPPALPNRRSVELPARQPPEHQGGPPSEEPDWLPARYPGRMPPGPPEGLPPRHPGRFPPEHPERLPSAHPDRLPPEQLDRRPPAPLDRRSFELPDRRTYEPPDRQSPVPQERRLQEQHTRRPLEQPNRESPLQLDRRLHEQSIRRLQEQSGRLAYLPQERRPHEEQGRQPQIHPERRSDVQTDRWPDDHQDRRPLVQQERRLYEEPDRRPPPRQGPQQVALEQIPIEGRRSPFERRGSPGLTAKVIEEERERFYYGQERPVTSRITVGKEIARDMISNQSIRERPFSSPAYLERQELLNQTSSQEGRDFYDEKERDAYVSRDVPGAALDLQQRDPPQAMMPQAYPSRGPSREEEERIPVGDTAVRMPRQLLSERVPQDVHDDRFKPRITRNQFEGRSSEKVNTRQHWEEERDLKGSIPGLEDSWDDSNERGQPKSSVVEMNAPRSWPDNNEPKDHAEDDRLFQKKESFQEERTEGHGNDHSLHPDEAPIQRHHELAPGPQGRSHPTDVHQAPRQGVLGRNHGIFRTRREDSSRGMFFCSVCRVYLADDDERTLHLHTQSHTDALKRRKEQNIPPFQVGQTPPRPQMRIRPQGSQDSGAVMSPATRPSRGMRPSPYGAHRHLQRPRGMMAPRYRGPP